MSWGCSPDKVTVTVGTSALERVKAGGVGTAKAKVVFSSIDDDVREESGQIARVVRKYLEDGDIETECDEMKTTFTATLNIPVLRSEKLPLQRDAVLAVVLRPDGHLEVAEGPRFSQLSHDLEDVNWMMDINLEGGQQVFRLVGDGGTGLVARVYGAFVDGKATPSGTVRVSDGDLLEVRFVRTDGSVYEKVAPFLELL